MSSDDFKNIFNQEPLTLETFLRLSGHDLPRRTLHLYAQRDGFTQEDIGQLQNILRPHNYVLVDTLGAGQTRVAFLATYCKNGVKQRRVVKIDKPADYLLENASPTTLINLSNGERNLWEILTHNELKHQNIVQLHELIKDPEYGDILVEEYFPNAKSLDSFSRMEDPRMVREVFQDILRGTHHLHVCKERLHRDIKPSNILVGKETTRSGRDRYHAKLTDLQNSRSLDSIENKCAPTRGGTSFTDPRILEKLIEGDETRYDLQAEIFSLGATLYRMVTGEDLSNVNLNFDEYGSELIIGDTIRKVSFFVNGEKTNSLDRRSSLKRIKKKIRKAPLRYQRLLGMLLVPDKYDLLRPLQPSVGRIDLGNIEDYYVRIERELDSATNPRMYINWQKHASSILLTSAFAGLIFGLSFFNHYRDRDDRMRMKQYPEFFDPQVNKQFSDTISNLKGDEYNYARLNLEDQLKAILKKGPQVDKKIRHVLSRLRYAGRTHIDRRITSSIARCVKLAPQSHISSIKKKGERVGPLLVPERYLTMINRKRTPLLREQIYGAVIRLIGLQDSSKHLSDIVVRYFDHSYSRDVAAAFSRNGKFFDSKTPLGNGVSTLNLGYSHGLAPDIGWLSKCTLATISVTDNEGNINYKKVKAMLPNQNPLSGKRRFYESAKRNFFRHRPR